MGISFDLLSQFAKLTTPTENNKKTETTIWGTTVEFDGSIGVQLDGSSTVTPVSTTANVKPGERVLVSIKNHSAIILGNVSSPSASTADVADVKSQVIEVEKVVADKVDVVMLEAEQARINSLVADNVNIKGTLNANTANIETLLADNVVIKGDLTAQNAKITTLESDNVTIKDTLTAVNAVIENLDVKYAKITDLEASNAEIDNLKTNKLSATDADIKYATIDNLNAAVADIGVLGADIADINTLIFGSATGEVIQTSFANAVVAQLGNAQIKSAMIDTVSASKITALNLLAGTINSKNVTIESEDGNLAIADETIQISDDTRVRVQIGKDASGDYSINIWDAEGKLMFSEGGLTENAVKDAIIRNDMVASDAAIDAGKLDIDSLFTEINGSSKTIKSSKIYLDKENQTLDVAFTTLTGNVSSQGTAISVIQDRITSKVWQQDINEATNAMSTQYSTLEQNLDSFKTTVGNTYATKGEVNTSISSVTQTADGLSARLYTVEHAGTDYMDFSTNGLIIGDMVVNTLGNNVLIDSDSIDIRNGTTAVARFKKDEIALGLNAEESEISLCGGRGSIHVDEYGTGAEYLSIDASGDLRLLANDDMTIRACSSYFNNGYDRAQIDMSYSTDGSGNIIAPYITIGTTHKTSNTTFVTSDLTLSYTKAELIAPSIDIQATTGDAEIYAGNGKFFTYSKNFYLADDGLDMEGDLTVSGDVYLSNNKQVYAKATDGSNYQVLRFNTNDNTVLGYGGYENSEGATNIYGNAVNITSKGNIALSGTLTLSKDLEIAHGGTGASTAAAARANLGVWTYDSTTNTSYPGLARPDGTTTGYIRTTQSGIIPYQNGGHGTVGTSSWPFNNGHFKNVYTSSINPDSAQKITINDVITLDSDGDIIIPNGKAYFGTNTSGATRSLIYTNGSNNTVVGYGGYVNNEGQTNIYGRYVKIFSKTANADYKPYYEAGDSISGTWWTNGHTTNGGTEYRFSVWLAKPIIGNPTVTITTTNGLYLRQNGKYLCGSSNSSPVIPSSYKPGVIHPDGNGVKITAVLPNTTDVTNNDACTAAAEIKITFS